MKIIAKSKSEEVKLDERVKLRKSAEKYLDAADRTTRNRLKREINKLTSPGYIANTKVLVGTPFARLAVGQYRVVYQTFYTADKLMVEIVDVADIGPRGQIYKNLKNL